MSIYPWRSKGTPVVLQRHRRRVWKVFLEQLGTVVIRQLNGQRFFGSEPLLLLPLKRLGAATALPVHWREGAEAVSCRFADVTLG